MPTTEFQLLVDEEFQQVILMALADGRVQTREELEAIVNEAQDMRLGALMLECVLAGKLSMYKDGDGETRFKSVAP